MQSKILLKRLLFIISIAEIVFFSIIIFFLAIELFSQGYYMNTKLILPASGPFLQNYIADKSVEFNAVSEQAKLGLPVRLKIPKINVDAAFEYVGLTADGSMDAPKSQDNVAWFNLGPRPGENGSAAVAGHYGIKDGKASVFDNLRKLRKGDKIYIEDDKGLITVFAVRESRRYDMNANASDVFVSNDGKSHLNLITCEGVWDKASQSYSKRLVVFTDKE